MKLLLVAGKNMILVVCDRLSIIIYFIATIEETLVKELAQLFRDTKELNRMLDIETKLLTLFYLQKNSQNELRAGTILIVLC